LETLVRDIDEIVKPSNVRKAKAGAKGRWDSKSTDTSSGGTK